MDAVAQRAGVSKQTVYTHFHSKDALFAAAIEALVKPMHDSLHGSQDDIEGCLRALAEVYCQRARDPSTKALSRILVAEAPRFPRAARQLYQCGSGAVLQRLSARIEHAMRRGELLQTNPDQAAELFLSMLNGMNPERSLLGLRQRGQKAQDKWAADAVNVFLRAYRPDSPSPVKTSRKSP